MSDNIAPGVGIDVISDGNEEKAGYEGMQKVRLVVACKAIEGDMLVQDVHILPFVVLPEAVIWGQRTFLKTDREHEGVPVYAEGIVVIALETLYGNRIATQSHSGEVSQKTQEARDKLKAVLVKSFRELTNVAASCNNAQEFLQEVYRKADAIVGAVYG